MDMVLATLNTGKVREFQSYLNQLDINVIPQSQFKNINEVAETGTTFVENAILKAKNAAQYTGLPAIADDSGLVVSALNGEPGIYSARYANETKNDASQQKANIAKLLHNMKDIPDGKRNAYFYCVIVLMFNQQDPTPIICQGRWDGKILFAPKGDGGFGYDPVFFVDEENKSAAELTLALKNKISHRGRALACLLKQLKSYNLIAK